MSMGSQASGRSTGGIGYDTESAAPDFLRFVRWLPWGPVDRTRLAPFIMKVNEIIAALPTLSADDRSRVKVALEILDSGDMKERDDTAELVWTLLRSVAGERGICLPGTMIKTRGYGSFKSKAKDTVEWITRSWSARSRKQPDKTELVQLVRLGARALLSRLERLHREIGLEITPNVVMHQVGNMPAAMQAQWPGGPDEWGFALGQRGS